MVVFGSNAGATLPALQGLGFDCENLGCSNGTNLGVEALINPATQAALALASRYRRFGPVGGAYILTGFGAEMPVAYDEPQAANEEQQPSQPQVIVIQQPVQAGADQHLAEAAPASEAAPLFDPGEFALVLKDGSNISAVAFTRQGDKLVYITRDGKRSTVSISNIDVDATTKLNDDRGTPIKLSI